MSYWVRKAWRLLYHWIACFLQTYLWSWNSVWEVMWRVWMTWSWIVTINYSRWIPAFLLYFGSLTASTLGWVTSTTWEILSTAWWKTSSRISFLFCLFDLIETLLSIAFFSIFDTSQYRVLVSNMTIKHWLMVETTLSFLLPVYLSLKHSVLLLGIDETFRFIVSHAA